MSKNIDEGDNQEILNILTEIKTVNGVMTRIRERMKIGLERYNHGIRVHDDTRQWGTKKDLWEEMALEELLDSLVYVSAAILRNDENKKDLMPLLNDIMKLTDKLECIVSSR